MILIKDITVLPFDGKDKVIAKTDVLIKGDRIEKIGKIDEKADRLIDGNGKVLMPGIVNAHTHIAMSLLRNYADDMPLHEWLNDAIWPIEGKMNAEDIYWGSMLTIAEMILSGTTTFLDMYDFMEETAKAVDQAGVRGVLTYGSIERPERTEKNIEKYRNFFKECDGMADRRVRVMIAPHAPYTCSDSYMLRLKDLADELGTGLNIHVSETQKEFDDSMTEYGKTPVQRLKDIGLFDTHTVAAHCVYLTDEDIDIIKEKNVYPVNNPTSNLKLASGFAPIKKMLAKGIPVALGTDGSSSNNNVNMFEEIHLAAILNKAVDKDATSVSAYEALKMATINGAKALGLDKEIGSIEVGKKADLILIDVDKPHFTPLNNVVSAIAYSAQGSDVDTVIVDGKLLMENRELKTIDIEDVMKNTNRIVEDLISRK